MCLILNGNWNRAARISKPVLHFGSWGWMKSKVNKRKVDTQDEFLALILDLLPTYRNMNINSDEQHTIFAYELQSALRLMMDMLNIYCELLTNLSFKH